MYSSLHVIFLLSISVIVSFKQGACIQACWPTTLSTCRRAFHAMLLTSASGSVAVSRAIAMYDLEKVRGSNRSIHCSWIVFSFRNGPSQRFCWQIACCAFLLTLTLICRKTRQLWNFAAALVGGRLFGSTLVKLLLTFSQYSMSQPF